MPFFEVAEECTYFNPNSICPAGSCKKNITPKQAVFLCSYCCKLYHPSCKGLIGSAKIKKASESNWYCSPDCAKSASSIPVPAVTNSPSSSALPSIKCGQCETSIQELLKRIDAQFAVLKSMLAELQDSQQFISKEFDNVKSDLKDIVAKNVILTKKCETLEDTTLKQDERILDLEFKLDGVHQRELNANLILVGLPDKLSEPSSVVRDLFNTLNCEKLLDDVISCDYVTLKHNRHISTDLTIPTKIIIKFRNSLAKNKVVQLKKKLKPTLTANDIGFSGNLSNIFFRDDLTPLRHKLFREARQIKKFKLFKYLWISDGDILIRQAVGSKTIRIASNLDLIKVAGTDSDN